MAARDMTPEELSEYIFQKPRQGIASLRDDFEAADNRRRQLEDELAALRARLAVLEDAVAKVRARCGARVTFGVHDYETHGRQKERCAILDILDALLPPVPAPAPAAPAEGAP